MKDYAADPVPTITGRPLVELDRVSAAAWVPAPVIPARFLPPGLSLTQIGSIIWAYRRLTAVIVFLVLWLTAALLLLWPRSYSATATLMVHYEVNDPLNGKDLPVGQIGSYIATQVELMQTPGVLLGVIDRLKLTANADYVRGYHHEDGTLGEWISGKLRKKLTIVPSPQGSQLIYVSYAANSAAEAAQVANTVAEVYKDQDRDRASGPSWERAQRYEKQLTELKANVDQVQAKVAEFRERNGVVDDGVKSNNDAALLGALETRLLEAQNARRVAETRVTQNAAVSDEVMASNEVQTLRAQVAAQELHLAQLGRIYGPQHPDFLMAQTQVDDSRRSLAGAVRAYAANASEALSMARRLEAKLEQAVTEQRTRVTYQSRLRDEAAKGLLELASAQEAYKRALDGRDQITFAVGIGPSSNVELISRATPPMAPSKPNVPAGAALGAVAALMLGLAVPLGYGLFHRRVRCRDDLERHHGLPVLAEFARIAKSTP